MLNYVKILSISIVIALCFLTQGLIAQETFSEWLEGFKVQAIKKGISEQTVNDAFRNVKFLEKVIGYDRKQPEFIEKTETYLSKRANKKSLERSIQAYKENKKILDKVETEFNVEKEYLLALWSIETNHGRNLGKMDIISSLATLSFDKRRRDYFSGQLFILLELLDKKTVSLDMLYGSWAGAMGNFQFMPSTLKSYGIDYNKDGRIDLKNSSEDSIASAANYLKKIGWLYNSPCKLNVEFSKDINKKLFNHSARNIKNKKSINYWINAGIKNNSLGEYSNSNLQSALVLPDGDINSPKYLVFNNYEKILKWNRSLRFGVSVCTLAEMIKNEI